jgi:hypothetical protein
MKWKVIFLLISITIVYAETVPIEVKTVIDETLSGKHFFVNFDKRNFRLFGDSTIKLSDIKAGTPFQKYSIPAKDVLGITKDFSLKDLITPCDDWLVPLSAHGKFISMLYIGKIDNKYVSYGVGGVPLGPVWEQVTRAWPNPMFLDIGSALYFHVPGHQKANNLTELRIHAINDLSTSNYKSLTSGYEILNELKIALQDLNKNK